MKYFILLIFICILAGCINSTVGFINNEKTGQSNTGIITKPSGNYIEAGNNSNPINQPAQKGNRPMWGLYGELAQTLKTLSWHIGLVVLGIILLVWLLPKYLPFLCLIPKMIMAILVGLIIVGLRYVVGMFIGGVNPIGEYAVDSILAVLVSHYIYGAFVRKKLFKRD